MVGTALTVSALVLIPSTAASAHVHGITPLRCTPAPPNASSTNGGPISSVIPITMGGNVPFHGGGFDAAVCTP